MRIKSVRPLENGMHKMQAEMLWSNVEGFAAYSFNKSHSVEYTLISYISMWLKVMYPAEFYAATLTVQDKDEKLMGLVKDAQKNGLEVSPPDIEVSTDRIEIDGERRLCAPLQAIKGISETTAKQIAKLRQLLGGRFTEDDLKDTKRQKELLGEARAPLTPSKVEALDKVGALYKLRGGLPPLHPDRLRDRIALMPGWTVETVRPDRKICAEEITKLKVLQMVDECRSCDKCSFKGGAHPVVRFGSRPQFMMVFDSPNWQEGKAGKMLEGDSAEYVKAALKDVGLTANDGYYTSLVKSPKPGTQKTLTNEQIIGCTPYLQRELELLRPPVIVAMGAVSSKFFSPDSKVKPSDLIGKAIYRADLDATVIFGINPAQIVFDPSKISTLQSVFATLAETLQD